MHYALIDPSQPIHWTVDGFLSDSECSALVERIEAAGPELAPITTSRGPRFDLDARNNARVMFDDAELAARLFERARLHVPESLKGMRPVGLNERFRCYRYEPGQQFGPHYDGAFVRDATERSLLTLMVYLNDDFAGGVTAFLELGRIVAPSKGRALFFQHPTLHQGCTVLRGTKYVIRSDVMYRMPARPEAAPPSR